ncbi:hypothetical protein BGZ97_007321 [Linnemannia gamsii]|jgi:hypothetical protein|uniref:Uncharacterized protein n=1 Tax=Linnemannia gamsii TaxID=64522 RepID=A0A9P6URJ4_9FUNG|nr:hypothetical protein BGZ97_007321 [Linnemannia gamsii]
MTHNTTSTTPTHNNNVSADKPSTVGVIKEKAAAVIDMITGKHHTDDTHGTHGQHHHGDPNVTHTTGATGAHTGTTGAHTGPVGTHTGAVHPTTGGALPAAAPTAVPSTGAGITTGGNIAPPAATHAQGTHAQGTHAQGIQGTHGTGLAGATATQPLNYQYNQSHPAGKVGHQDDSNTAGGVQNQPRGGMATSAATNTNPIDPSVADETKAAFMKGIDIGTRHPERVDQAVQEATTRMVGHQPNEQTALNATANAVANDPRKADVFTDDVAARLVGEPGDPNNLEAAHIKPTM